MKQNLTEKQLRNIVYNTIKESIYGDEMYFVEDEADGAVVANIADKDEAIADAKERVAYGTGHFLVKDRDDNVIYDTGGPSYKFESREIKCNESQMREYVANIIRESLEEIMHSEYHQGASIEECLKNDGWKIAKNAGNKYQIEQMTSFAGAPEEGSLSLDELIEDLNMFVKDNGLGQSVQVLNRGRIGNSEYADVAETAIIQII